MSLKSQGYSHSSDPEKLEGKTTRRKKSGIKVLTYYILDFSGLHHIARNAQEDRRICPDGRYPYNIIELFHLGQGLIILAERLCP